MHENIIQKLFKGHSNILLSHPTAEPTTLPFLGSEEVSFDIEYFLLHFWGCVIVNIKKSGNQHKHWIFTFPDFPKNNRIWVLILTHAQKQAFLGTFQNTDVLFLGTFAITHNYFWVTFSTHKNKGGTLCTRRITKDDVRKNLSPNVTRSADAIAPFNPSMQISSKQIRLSNPFNVTRHSKTKTTQQTSLSPDRMVRNMSESV